MPDQTKKRKLLGKIRVLAGAFLLAAVGFSAVVVTPFAPRVAHAECTLQDADGNYYDNITSEPCTPGAPAPTSQPGAQTSDPKTASAWSKIADALQYLNPLTWAPAIARAIAVIILTIMALIAGLAGMFLELAMQFTLNMSTLMKQVTIVDVGWTAFRDLANMAFIFILIYIAIKTILDVGETRKMLKDVIVTALLINFSLFFCKVAVDTSNFIAGSFYNKMQGEYAPAAINGLEWSRGPASTMFAAMNLPSIFKPATASTYSFSNALIDTLGINNLQQVMATITQAVLGSILLLVFAFVMAAAAVMLVLRVVTLMFLMMLSPLAVVARILPRAQSSWNKWFEAFVNNAIYAPAFFALLYVIIKTTKNGLPGYNGNFVDLVKDPMHAVGVIINYVFLIILVAGTIFVAKSLSIHGASTASALGQSASRWARGAAKRQTVGRTVSAVRDSDTFKNFARKNPTIGRALYGGMTRVTGSKALSGGYDQQRTKADAKTAKYVAHVGPEVQSAAPNEPQRSTLAPEGRTPITPEEKNKLQGDIDNQKTRIDQLKQGLDAVMNRPLRGEEDSRRAALEKDSLNEQIGSAEKKLQEMKTRPEESPVSETPSPGVKLRPHGEQRVEIEKKKQKIEELKKLEVQNRSAGKGDTANELEQQRVRLEQEVRRAREKLADVDVGEAEKLLSEDRGRLEEKKRGVSFKDPQLEKKYNREKQELQEVVRRAEVRVERLKSPRSMQRPTQSAWSAYVESFEKRTGKKVSQIINEEKEKERIRKVVAEEKEGEPKEKKGGGVPRETRGEEKITQ